MASNRMNVCLRILRNENKSRYDSFSVKDVPCFDNVQSLKDHIFKRCPEELSPATNSHFPMGYFGETNKRFSISTVEQLAEAISLAKKGLVTLWVDPHEPKILEKKRKGM